MRIDILTLFPNMFDGFVSESIIKRAINNNKVTSQDNQYPTSLSFEIYRAGSITYKNLMIKKI